MLKMENKENKGSKIVLTANRTLMSHYNGLIFLGFGACVTKGLIPDMLYYSLLCPPIKANKDGSAVNSPNGTRKIESSLLNDGFDEDDVIVAHPDHLDKAIGPQTKVLSITEIDPLGIAPATSTFTQMFGGDAYMKVKFEEMINHPSVQKYRPKIIIGGPGAWEFEDPETRKDMKVDCVIFGEGEKVVNNIFEDACQDKDIPEMVYGKVVPVEEIPLIQKPTIDGIIEIARGCGRGCKFCNPTLRRYRCLPLEHILKEVEVNLKVGYRPLLHSEDVLRYNAHGFQVNEEAVINLFRQVKNFPGVDEVCISHFALSSVVDAPETVEEISNILEVDEKSWFSGQTGIETGSPQLIKDTMGGKCKPFKAEDWPKVVVDAFQILDDNSWIPVSTLIIGLPHETEEDIQLTIDLVDELKEFKSVIMPLFYVSQGGMKEKTKSFDLNNINQKECELLLKCWDHSLDWAEILLKEYFQKIDARGIRSYLAQHIFKFSNRKGRKLLKICENEYNYDIPSMMEDAREGEFDILPQLCKRFTTFLYEVKGILKS